MNYRIKEDSIFELINRENQRQKNHIELIASENFASKNVREAQGSILTNKYAEGYPKNRYYGGCEVVDEIETIAIQRLKKLFDCKYANVQPHSGSQANAAVFQALLNPGDKILSLSLNEGGHLTHGFKLNFSGIIYESHFYSVDEKTELLDYDQIQEIANKIKPKLIITGYSSYSRKIDFKRFRKIADSVGAFLHADIAHIAGLVAAGLHQSPIPFADVVTSTTHKTLRGPRGGIIMTNNFELYKKINRSVFPGNQGGPLMHVISAKAIAFKEALEPDFFTYQSNILKNCKALVKEFQNLGYRIVSGGSDNHLLVIDVYKKTGLTGFEAEKILDSVNITCNKNLIPYDEQKPKHTSGIRLGTAAVTTRGLNEIHMKKIVNWIHQALENNSNNEELMRIKDEVIDLMNTFPLVFGE
jgi:glycine hydroxymethyltransferase|tara:strand:- start:11698 stop:12942 length:1245 start_codon:yes stop_codon:yes gene_type:complete